jgi:hypothetical protein
MDRRSWWALAPVLSVALGCGRPPEEEELEQRTSKLVQFGDAVTAFGDFDGGSETATLVNQSSFGSRKIVAFNFEDHAHVTYSATDRTVCPGASLMGWATAPTTPGSAFTRKRVPAPAAFPVLWGDPGIGQVPGTGLVYMANLAVPAQNMPAGGACIHGGLTQIGAACIARSTDGGQNFTLSTTDCLYTPDLAFYDGTAITGTAPGGAVYAAFFHTTGIGNIDTYRAATPTRPFLLMPNGFPGKAMCDHPRMTSDGSNMFIMAKECATQRLWLNYATGGTWGSAANGWPLLVGSDYTGQNDIVIKGLPLRRGAEYDLMINTNGLAFSEYVEVLYAATVGTHSVLRDVSCRIFAGGGNQKCTLKGTIDPGVHAFHPSVAVADVRPAGGGETVVYQATWSQQVGDTVQIFSALLNGPTGTRTSIVGRSETGGTEPCPDKRVDAFGNESDYWGDYNNHLGMFQPTPADNPLFWTGFSDSTDASRVSRCTTRNAFNSAPLNASATWINFP